MTEASLVLRDGADLKVVLGDGTIPSTSPYPTSSSTGGISVTLAKSVVAITGGSETDRFSASTPAQFMAGSTIDGGGGSCNTLTLSYDYTNSVGMTQIDPVTGQLVLIPPNPSNSVYDLTRVGSSRVESLQASGPGAYSSTTTVIKADTASLKDFTSITLSGNAVLTTEAATFDLSGKSIYGYSGGGAVTSLNAVGTIFTVDSASVAVSIQGGAGQDTVMVKGGGPDRSTTCTDLYR